MLPSQPSWPSEQPDQLAALLREQGATPEEIADLLPAVQRLAEWRAPAATPAETRRLIAALTLAPPVLSPVRQAIHQRRERQGVGVVFLLATARTQVSLFGMEFWLVSAFLTLVGAVVVLSKAPLDHDVVLRAIGPLLAYLGTIVAFRGKDERTLELELVCLPSPLQLALARLVIVLGYDVGLGLALSLALWAGGSRQALALTLAWIMPMLLVAGLALLLSLRLSIQAAASVAYGSWLAFLALGAAAPLQAPPLTPLSEALLGGLGLALVAVALLRIHTDMGRLLPRA